MGSAHRARRTTPSEGGVPPRDELVVSKNYRMSIYQTFQHIEKISYQTSNIKYLDIDLICVFLPKNSLKIPKILWKSETSPEIPKIQKILQKFRKFAEISENLPKIPQKEGLF